MSIYFVRFQYGAFAYDIVDVAHEESDILEVLYAELYSVPYRVLQSSKSDSFESKRARLQLESLDELKKTFNVLPLSGFAEFFALEHERLRCEGRPMEDIDLLKGSFAKTNGYTLVTGNGRHFERISGLIIDNWYI